jgi:hypothetical protein
MNTDERRLKTIALSAFISVDRRLNLPFPDFFSSLLKMKSRAMLPLLAAIRVSQPRRAAAHGAAGSPTI